MYVLGTELKSPTTACNVKIKSLSNKLKPEWTEKVSFAQQHSQPVRLKMEFSLYQCGGKLQSLRYIYFLEHTLNVFHSIYFPKIKERILREN